MTPWELKLKFSKATSWTQKTERRGGLRTEEEEKARRKQRRTNGKAATAPWGSPVLGGAASLPDQAPPLITQGQPPARESAPTVCDHRVSEQMMEQNYFLCFWG